VHGELVVVATAGALQAYERASGEPRWSATTSGGGYSSPQLLELEGVEQLVFLSGEGASGIALEDGATLWHHPWSGEPIVQPARTADGDLLLNAGNQGGVLRLDVAHGADGWTANELWTSMRLKPFVNDLVVHAGHAYGFDGGILASVDLEDGTRSWKGGRYGRGQLVLLAEQELLLVLSELGQVALVDATPERFHERASFQAIEGKTWNHPVVVDGVLLVRNAEEMAAFRLSSPGA
jgi:hypothetical protein